MAHAAEACAPPFRAGQDRPDLDAVVVAWGKCRHLQTASHCVIESSRERAPTRRYDRQLHRQMTVLAASRTVILRPPAFLRGRGSGGELAWSDLSGLTGAAACLLVEAERIDHVDPLIVLGQHYAVGAVSADRALLKYPSRDVARMVEMSPADDRNPED
jgi:hypothetical protein